MDAAQQHLFKLLVEIDDICRKYDIQYYLEYGTILGAVRHEGFIPWDNDIDISMTEDNYYKWLEACTKELDPEKRVFCDGRIDREYPVVFGRYIDLETFRMSPKMPFWKNLCGQCIDVFCLMELPGDPVKKQNAIDRYYAYDEYMMSGYRHYRMKSEREMQLYRRYTRWGKIIGKDRMLKILERRIFHHHYDDCDTYLVDSARKRGGPPSLVPKDCYDTVYMADFEGRKFPIPGKYVDILMVYYGDSYCMLPEEKRIHSQMSDTGIKCEDYVDNYMRYVDKEDLLKKMQIAKDCDVEEGYRATHCAKAYFVELAAYEALKLKNKIEEKHININDYLDVSDMGKLKFLNDFFQEYYAKQLHKDVLYWEVYFDIGDDLVYAALIALLYYQRNYSKTLEVLKLREKSGIQLEGKWKELYDLIGLIRKVKAEIVYGHIENADKCLKEGLSKYPYCHALRVDRLSVDVLLAGNESDYEACEEEANHLLKIYQKDEQCIKALGDISFQRKDYGKAEDQYEWIMNHSANGLYHLDIKKKREAYYD